MYTRDMMNYEWDEAKNESNLAKHGISFEEAAEVFSDPRLLTFQGKLGDGGEERFISIGLVPSLGSIVVTVVHTDRDGTTRIISTRKANRKERAVYG